MEIEINEFKLEEIPMSCTWIIIGQPGSGKCMAPDTPIIMFDGTIKKIKEIVVGDRLMGDDSSPRSVISVTSGVDKMYRVCQSKGDDYIVNGPHILVLKRRYTPRISQIGERYKIQWMFNNIKKRKVVSTAEYAERFLSQLKKDRDYTIENILEISVDQYLQLTEKKIRKYKGFRVGVHFEKTTLDLELDPPSFSFPSQITEPREIGISVGKMLKNGIRKRIPNDIKTAKRIDRLEMLAGLIDTVYGSRAKKEDHYEFFTTSRPMAEDIAFISRSCGLYTTITEEFDKKFKIVIYGRPFPSSRKNASGLASIVPDLDLSDITIESIGDGAYCGFEIDGNRRFLLGDFTVTHNTTLIENLCYYNKHKYPVARVFIGTEAGYQKFSDIFNPLYVSNYYDEDQERSYILRQRTAVLENNKGYVGNYAINILDDVSDDPKIFKTKIMKGIFKLGSQHWEQLFILGSQYIIDTPPDIRTSTSYVALFREPEECNRKKLFENFGGLAGNYKRFCELMDQLTGDYTCLIFKKRSQSNELQECVYFYKTKVLPPWTFGCKEYRDWAKSRYNPNYVEKIVM